MKLHPVAFEVLQEELERGRASLASLENRLGRARDEYLAALEDKELALARVAGLESALSALRGEPRP